MTKHIYFPVTFNIKHAVWSTADCWWHWLVGWLCHTASIAREARVALGGIWNNLYVLWVWYNRANCDLYIICLYWWWGVVSKGAPSAVTKYNAADAARKFYCTRCRHCPWYLTSRIHSARLLSAYIITLAHYAPLFVRGVRGKHDTKSTPIPLPAVYFPPYLGPQALFYTIITFKSQKIPYYKI